MQYSTVRGCGGRAAGGRGQASIQSKPGGATAPSLCISSEGSIGSDISRSTTSLQPSMPSPRAKAKVILGRGVKPWLIAMGICARLTSAPDSA